MYTYTDVTQLNILTHRMQIAIEPVPKHKIRYKNAYNALKII